MRILAQSGLGGLIASKLLRAVVIVCTIVFASCVLLYGGARTLLMLESRSAASFLEELSSVQIGQSESSVLPLIQRYGNPEWDQVGSGNSKTHWLSFDPWHLRSNIVGWNRMDEALRRLLLSGGNWRRRLGLRHWVTTGTISISEGIVTSVSATLIVEGENEWLLASWHLVGELPSYLTERYRARGFFQPGMGHYVAHWTHLHMGATETGEGLIDDITPLATAEEIQAAHNINLRCLTSMRGCHSLCELMPDADRFEREHNYPGWGWNSGSWGEQDRACQ